VVNDKAYHNETFMQDTKVHDGIFEILEFLKKKKVRLGIITLRSKEMAYNVTSGLGLDKYMDITIAGGEVPMNKPSGYPIVYACSKFGIMPSKSVMVGDSTVDIICGKDAGAKSIGVLWGSDSEDELRKAGADMIVRSPKELKELFSRFLGLSEIETIRQK
ncbi:MAG: HAD-IA family hydrolase, partial [Thermoplasmata archaeon]